MEDSPSLEDMINYVDGIIDNIDHWLLSVDVDNPLVVDAVLERSMFSAIVEQLARLEDLEH